MVFSSFQAYLDSSNWQQPPTSNTFQNTGTATGAGGANLLTPHPQLPPPVLSQPLSHGHAGGSVRPGSMADRARLANIPMPETALKCPRCESTNTKFCYFNNYSLTQPRHFCKTCRRYWTRGGALRNVPVGGGCRRNKRTKSNGNNSTSNNNTASASTATSNSSNANMTSAVGPSMIGSILGGHHDSILNQIFPPVRLMGPYFQHLNEPPATDNATAAATSIGLLNYDGDLCSIQNGSPLATASGVGSILSSLDQWKPSQAPSLPQFPALGVGNFEPSGFYPFEGNVDQSGPSRMLSSSISSALATQLASVKVEDNPFKRLPWTDLSYFGSSSAGNQL